jgi:mevalonate kinase
MARAAGKVILLGEHAVVYGVPALAAGIALGARAEATLGGEVSTLSFGESCIVAGEGNLGFALAALLAEGTLLPAMSIRAESDLPPASGLGSSAAIGVAVARAALAAAGLPASDDAAIARATAWERVFHGNPSGIDTAAAALGGCFRFTRAGGAEPGHDGAASGPKPRAHVEPIHLPHDLPLCVGLSGSTASTKVMVEGLARLRERKTEMVDESIAAIASLVENARLAAMAGDLPALGQLMNLNQMLLSGLFLSTEKLEDLCALARGAGALGAKLTGKGGGGAVLALCASEEACAPVLAAWRASGYEGFATKVSTRHP